METGRVRWETKVSPDSEQYFFHGDPLVADGVIVVGADRATGASIHALEISTGKELWKHAAGRGVNGPIAGLGSRAFATTVDGQLLALDVRSGTLRWNTPLKSPGWEGPAGAGDRVFAGTVDGWLYAFDPETGRERWRLNVGAPVTTTVTASGGDVYLGTADGSLHRVDAQRGTVIHALKLHATLVPTSVVVRTPTALLVLLTNKAAEHQTLLSIDPSLQQVRWRLEAPTPWNTTRAFTWGDVVVLGTASGDISAYCQASGSIAWSRTVKGPVRSVGGDANTLLIGTRTGDLYAMRAPRSCALK